MIKLLKSEQPSDSNNLLNIFLNQVKTTHLNLTEKSVAEDPDPLEDSQVAENPIVAEPVIEVKNDAQLISSFFKGYNTTK